MSKENSNKTVEVTAKWAIKDSVFRNLFLNKKYLIQLYQCLHPDDKIATMDDLEYITLENVLVNDIYNDLGFLVGNKLLVLVEAQSTWTENIIIRCLMYIARTYQDYFSQTDQSVYGTTKVNIPEPELYVIYTGSKRISKKVITLSEEFFKGKTVALDVRVNVITDGKEGDIINQYVVFTKVVNEQIRTHGRNREAVKEAIRICKERNVLKEYLVEREMEVVDIMIALFDQEQVVTDYIKSERRITRENTIEEERIQFYLRLRSRGLSQKDAQEMSNTSDEQVEKANKML